MRRNSKSSIYAVRKYMKMNCWEWKKCGRQPGGAKIRDLGVCPASTATAHDGKNNGKNAGRYCWKVAGTLCNGKVQGIYASRLKNCIIACEFYQKVKEEEGDNFIP